MFYFHFLLNTLFLILIILIFSNLSNIIFQYSKWLTKSIFFSFSYCVGGFTMPTVATKTYPSITAISKPSVYNSKTNHLWRNLSCHIPQTKSNFCVHFNRVHHVLDCYLLQILPNISRLNCSYPKNFTFSIQLIDRLFRNSTFTFQLLYIRNQQYTGVVVLYFDIWFRIHIYETTLWWLIWCS